MLNRGVADSFYLYKKYAYLLINIFDIVFSRVHINDISIRTYSKQIATVEQKLTGDFTLYEDTLSSL